MAPRSLACHILLLIVLVVHRSSSHRDLCKLTRRLNELRCANITAHFLPTEWLWSISDDIHGFSSELQRLEFTNCNINTLQHQSFKNMPHLKQISLTHMSLKEVEKAAFEGVLRLKWVDMSYNSIQTIPIDTFKESRLSHLKLEGNTLTMPTNGPLLDADKLTWLSLRNCSIQHMSGSVFQLNTHLAHLDLSHNQLEMLPQHIFSPIQHLVYLDLSFNRFQTLDFSVIQAVPLFPQYPKNLILAGNRWVCNCKMAELIQWGNGNPEIEAKSWATHPRESRLRKLVKCEEPSELAGKNWLTLHDALSNC